MTATEVAGVNVASNDASLEDVHAFWNAHPCGAWRVREDFGTRAFYDSYRAYRYRKHWHLPELVPFEKFSGKQVLEIGCGLGADGVRFAQGGAFYTGIDLTEAAVEATRMHFGALGLEGEFLVQDAEHMAAIPDARFDAVYSHGVLHHTPNLGAALNEIARVLKPRGQLILMLYHRHSLNYYVRILGFQRVAALAYTCVHAFLPRAFRSQKMDQHVLNYRRLGRRYFGASEFPHHCADGVDCPIAYSYSRKQLRTMLSRQFGDPGFAVAHVPMREAMPYLPLWLERAVARRLGWYLFTYARKADGVSEDSLPEAAR
jgi:ubiquinone/menaquinone biosynthesis C-methylase UbiE